MRYSVRQAADMAGISRKTMYAHISKGKVSAVSDNEGNKVIDHAELLRVYGKQLETPKVTPSETPLNQSDELFKARRVMVQLNEQNKHLKRENELLKQLLIDAREREKATEEKHRETLSIFKRLLPGKD